MECNEGSKSFVDIDGIRHSFDTSIHVSSSEGLVEKPLLAFLHLLHGMTLIPNPKMILSNLPYMLRVIQRRTIMKLNQVVLQGQLHKWVKFVFPHFPPSSIGPHRPLPQELYPLSLKHPPQLKLGSLLPQVTMLPVWTCWR